MKEKIFCRDLEREIEPSQCYHSKSQACENCTVKAPILQRKAFLREKESKRRIKPDRQLSYWNNWAIYDAVKRECLVKFAPDFSREYRGNMSKLCEDIKYHPEQALRSPIIWHLIAFVRENEMKRGLPKGSFKKLLKAMEIDWRRSPFSKVDLQNMARRDLFFFLKMLNRGEGVSIFDAVIEYRDEIDKKDRSAKERRKNDRFMATKNYEKIYGAYRKVYDQLTADGKLTHKEAIHFLEFAGQKIHQPSEYSIWNPDGRPLLYAKGEYIIPCDLRILL